MKNKPIIFAVSVFAISLFISYMAGIDIWVRGASSGASLLVAVSLTLCAYCVGKLAELDGGK